MTLKFCDTNPSVLLKGLEYLNTVFKTLIEDEYTMLEAEAAAFIPSLIIKVIFSSSLSHNCFILKRMVRHKQWALSQIYFFAS